MGGSSQKERTFMVPDKVSSQVDSGDGWDKTELAQNKDIQDLFTSHFREAGKSPSANQSQTSHMKPILQTFSCSGNPHGPSKTYRSDMNPVPNCNQWTSGKTASLDNSIYGLQSRRLCNMTGGWDPAPCIPNKLSALPQIPTKEFLAQRPMQPQIESDYMLKTIDHQQSYHLPQA